MLHKGMLQSARIDRIKTLPADVADGVACSCLCLMLAGHRGVEKFRLPKDDMTMYREAMFRQWNIERWKKRPEP